jgi:hypothetical protein
MPMIALMNGPEGAECGKRDRLTATGTAKGRFELILFF